MIAARLEFSAGSLAGPVTFREVVPDGSRPGLTWTFTDACYALAFVVTHRGLSLLEGDRDRLAGVASDLLGMGRGRP